MGTFKNPWMVSKKKKDTNWLVSGFRALLGATAVDVETTGVNVVGVDGMTLAGAALGVSTLSVVGIMETGTSFPDSRDIGVIGSDGILDPA